MPWHSTFCLCHPTTLIFFLSLLLFTLTFYSPFTLTLFIGFPTLLQRIYLSQVQGLIVPWIGSHCARFLGPHLAFAHQSIFFVHIVYRNPEKCNKKIVKLRLIIFTHIITENTESTLAISLASQAVQKFPPFRLPKRWAIFSKPFLSQTKILNSWRSLLCAALFISYHSSFSFDPSTVPLPLPEYKNFHSPRSFAPYSNQGQWAATVHTLRYTGLPRISPAQGMILVNTSRSGFDLLESSQEIQDLLIFIWAIEALERSDYREPGLRGLSALESVPDNRDPVNTRVLEYRYSGTGMVHGNHQCASVHPQERSKKFSITWAHLTCRRPFVFSLQLAESWVCRDFSASRRRGQFPWPGTFSVFEACTWAKLSHHPQSSQSAILALLYKPVRVLNFSPKLWPLVPAGWVLWILCLAHAPISYGIHDLKCSGRKVSDGMDRGWRCQGFLPFLVS